MTYPRRPSQVNMQRPRKAGDANGSRLLGRGPAEARAQVAVEVQLVARPRPIARLRGAPSIGVSAAARARIAAAVRGAASLSITAGARPETDASHLLRFGEGEYFRWNDVEYASPLDIPGAVFTSLDPITDIVGGRVVTYAAGTLPANENGLLIWGEARSNILLRSQEHNLAPWSLAAASITADATTAPDGTLTADLLLPTAANAQHVLWQNYTTTTGVRYVRSVFLKKQGWAQRLRISAPSDNVLVSMAGDLPSLISGPGTIVPLANGWCRIDFSWLETAGQSRQLGRIVFQQDDGNETFAGDGVSGVFIWGSQEEPDASQVGPYIATGAGAVTRRGNRLVLPISGPTEGISVVEFTARIWPASGAARRILGMNGGSPNLGALYPSVSGTNAWEQWSGSSGLFGAGAGASPLNRRQRVAVGFSGSGRALAFEGAQRASDSNPVHFSGPPTQLAIGSRTDGGDPLPGHYHRIAFHRARADSRLPALTSAPVVGPTHWLRFDPAAPLYRWAGKNYATLLDIPGVAFTQLDPITDVVDGVLTTFAAGVPAISKNGLLLWPEDRTNLYRWSMDQTNAVWVKANCAFAGGKLTPAAGSSVKHMSQLVTTAGTVTISALVRNAGHRYVTIGANMDGFTRIVEAVFDLQNLTTANGFIQAGGSQTSSIRDMGGGLLLLVATLNGVSTGAQTYITSGAAAVTNVLNASYSSDGVSGVTIEAMQAEAASINSPFMVTTTASVTRRANRLVLPWQITPSGMMVAEVTSRLLRSSNGRVVGMSNSHTPIFINSNGIQIGAWNEAQALASTALTAFLNRRAKMAVGWSPSGRIAAADGATRGSDTFSIAGPNGWGFTQLAIGSQVAGGADSQPGHYHALSIFGFRDDSRLPSLTT